MGRDIDDYEKAYLSDYGFEKEMVRYRQQLVIERMLQKKPQTVVEIGCGFDLLFPLYRKRGGDWKNWVIVEPAREFVQRANDAAESGVQVIHSTFEAAAEKIAKTTDNIDMIICSGLLHEVSDAHALLVAIQCVMDSETIVHINVPNADSFHRRLAVSMGLIDDGHQFSARNEALQQSRVYDINTLAQDLENAGLSIVETGGYLIKPFTHDQMEKIIPVLGHPVLDGLNELGKSLPSLASEIFAEAILA